MFKNVIGQERTKDLLRGLVQRNRIPHAQLFLGAEGAGGLSMARAFIQYIFCENRSDVDACGTCRTCTKIQKNIHADLHYAYPTVGSKKISTHFLKEWRKALVDSPYMNINQWLGVLGADNKQGNITKDECVNIVKKLSLKTFEAKYKVLIMWLPEYLGKEGNRLLKLIEEPPENTLFILVAEQQEKILNTILSRCQLIKINPLQDEDVAHALMQQKGIAEPQAWNIARLADGNYTAALSLINSTQNDNADLFLKWFRICYKGNGKEMVDWTTDFAKIGRESQKHFLKYTLHFLREYMVLKLTNSDKVRLQGSELKAAKNMVKVINFKQIGAITELINSAFSHVERNANPKVLFLNASIKLNKILRGR